MDCNCKSKIAFPFGAIRWESGAKPTEQPFDFTGQRLQRSFGLHDYNARFYDSTLGRFISPDSIVPDFANPQDLNRYSYVRNNPVRFTDPTGHATECGVTRDDCGTAVDGPTMVAIHRSQQWREENPELVQAMQEAPVSIVCEYCDWAITLNHWRQGDFHWTDTLGLLPVIPVAAFRTARWLIRSAPEGAGRTILYHGTSSVYEASIRSGINPPAGGVNFRGNQLGDGFYTTTSLEAAETFATGAVKNLTEAGLPGGKPIVLEIAVDMSEMTGVGVPRYLWWETPQSLIYSFDYLEAPISGSERYYQYKFNPSAYGNLEVLP